MSKKRLLRLLYYSLSVIFWIALWWLCATLANRKLMLPIPTPADTVRVFIADILDSQYRISVYTSVCHIVLGFSAAVVVGSVFGLLSGNSKFFKMLSSPPLHLVRTVPVVAFIIIAWLWVPTSILPSVIAFLMVLPIIWSHVDSGLSSVDSKLVEMAQVYGMKKGEIIRTVTVPSVMPSLRTGCITGLGIAWKSGVAAEVICNPSGSIGALLQKSKAQIEYDRVFSVTLTVVILSIILENILKLVWKEQKR